jgi:hydrogenase expression/formation protein HypC
MPFRGTKDELEEAHMCLGVPGKVIEVDRDMQVATVDFWGVRRQVRLEICDAPVEPGDYILNHVGFAIRRIPPEDAAETLALYDELLRLAEEDDLMAQDVRGEIDAAGNASKTEGGGESAA